MQKKPDLPDSALDARDMWPMEQMVLNYFHLLNMDYGLTPTASKCVVE